MGGKLVIGLGSNLGDSRMQLKVALRVFCALSDARLVAVSSLYISPALLHPDNPKPQPNYYNQVALLTTSCSLDKLLNTAKRIEARLGRDFSCPRWSARPIDIDLLDYDGIQYQSNRLILPHRQIAARGFVVHPWLEIEPQAYLLHQPLKILAASLK